MSDFSGIYRGVVIDNDDPEYQYRVITQIPQVLGDAPSNWCEPMLPTLYIPRIGDIVWVMFVNGDLTTPLYQSRVTVNREMMEPGTLNLTGNDIADFSIVARKMKNNLHYIY